MTPRPRRGRPAGAPPANPKGAIQDWLTLVEPDGAFLTPGQLNAVFPQGFEPMPAEHRTELRAQVADLDDDSTARTGLREWLLSTVLDWEDQLVDGQRIPARAVARAAEHGVELRPGQALVDVDDPNKVRLGVFAWPPGTRMDRRPEVAVAGDSWPASPVQRAETWCRESGVPLALVTDDDHWMLVWAPRQAPAASCRWRVADLADERILQAGFVSLLGARRFFAVPDDETVESLFRQAADAEAEITKGLGTSVRRSVELLVAAMSRDDVAHDHRILADVPSTDVYEAAVTVLMRLVFLLFAEERQLLPAEDPLWAESYSVLTLRDDLRSAEVRDGIDALERRTTAWHRLLATFRAVHGGANHDRLTLPAYGGSLFDPDRFPFLEGRRIPVRIEAGAVDLGPADDAAAGTGRPVGIDDRTVLAILDALLNIKVKLGRATVTQRVSYKALDVEQIGHCYEGLLDHGCAPINVLSLGLNGPDGAEPEIAITDLEERLAAGEEALCEWLADKTRCNKQPSALAKLLANQPEGVDLARLRAACGHDDATVEQVRPFWGLIRNDLRGLPIVLLPGSQYVTQTSTRRNMGAQYTTKALAEEVVQYALEPLVYEPGPRNEPDHEKWRLRTPGDILALRVCDPAVGSGAILTAAGRYLAERLVESVDEYGPAEGPFAERLATLATATADEQTVLARREVVDHCLYGVDKNPVAAEMAKLSLWLTTMARERPFTFLDHAIQVGDSLLGITDLDQLRWLHLDPDERKGVRGFESVALDLRVKDATELARRLQALSVVTVRDAAEKERLHNELRAKLADLSVVADAVVGATLSTAGKGGGSAADRLDTQIDRIRTALNDDHPEIERTAALEVLHGVATAWLRTDLPDDPPMPWDRQCLHWPLSFPEVFLEDGRTGFDAIVGNPPFLGGTDLLPALGASLRNTLVDTLAGGRRGIRGQADLCVYFLLRICLITTHLGILATNSIGVGDSREVGLDHLLEDESWTLVRTQPDRPWPGEAQLVVSILWLVRSPWISQRFVGDQPVDAIGPDLRRAARVMGDPHRTRQPFGQLPGSKVNGKGFVLSAEAATAFRRDHPDEVAVLRTYVGGEDINDSPTHLSDREIISFWDWPLSDAQDYPNALDIVEERVRTAREAGGRDGWRERMVRVWWQFEAVRMDLYRALAEFDRVVAIAQTSRTCMPALVPADVVFSHSAIVFLTSDIGHFGTLTSEFHRQWAFRYGSSMKSDLRYVATRCFETFPQPEPQSGPLWEGVRDAGQRINEFRSDLMVRTDLGLTKTYNRVHDPDEDDPDVQRLRDLHVELDHAVRDAYGWADLVLDHHHWETAQEMRFTVSPEAKDELLDRLLELNHERHAAEVAAGLHEKKSGKTKAAKRAARRTTKSTPGQGSLM